MDVVVNEATYSLPCRSFFIDYSVTDRRQLPVVKEFVVRFLFYIGSCPAETLQGFFGFTGPELHDVLADLERDNLITWEEGEIALTNYTKGRFEAVDGKRVPRFFSVVDELDHVSFDLVSFRLITGRSSGKNGPGNVDIRLDPRQLQHVRERAQEAFDLRFSEFLEKQKKLDRFETSRELYKINSVVPKSDFALPVKVEFSVESTEAREVVPRYADEWMEEFDYDQSILGPVHASVADAPRLSNAKTRSVEEYLAATGDPVTREFVHQGVLDVRAFVDAASRNRFMFDKDTRALVGNLYTETNMNLITGLLGGAEGREKLRAKGGLWSVCPDGKLWGRTAALQALVSEINARFDSRYRPGRIVLCLAVESLVEARKLDNFYNSAGAALQGTVAPFCNTDTEVLVIPGVLAVSLFHAKQPSFGGLSVPVGFASTNPEVMAALQERVQEWTEDASNLNTYLKRGKPKPEEKANAVVTRLFE
jgi:hypothetical protein